MVGSAEGIQDILEFNQKRSEGLLGAGSKVKKLKVKKSK